MSNIQQILWNNFSWWMSNDPSLWPEGSFFDWGWIDIGSDSKKISLSNWLNNVSSFPNSGSSEYVIDHLANSTSNWIALKNRGKVYNFFGDMVKDFDSRTRLMGRSPSGQWFVLKSNGEVRTRSLDLSADLWIGSETLNFTLSNPVGQKVKYLTSGNFIFFFYWRYISVVDTTSSTWVETETITVDRDLTITWVTRIWDQVMVYGTKWLHGRQYFFTTPWLLWWDTFERVIDWYDKPIVDAVNFNNIDYVFTRDRSWNNNMYEVQGYQARRLYKSTRFGNNDRQNKFMFWVDAFLNVWPNVLETSQEELFIAWNGNLYRFGNKHPWLPRSIVRDALYPSDWDWGQVTCISLVSDFLYIFFQGDTLNWDFNRSPYFTINISERVNSYSILNPWYLITLPYYGDTYGTMKKAIKLRLWYKLEESTQINAYYRVNKWFWYANFYTFQEGLGSYTTAPSIWDVYSNWWVNYTVYDITLKDEWNIKDRWLIIHCTYDESSWEGNYEWTLTKVSWDWDATFLFDRAFYWYKILHKFISNDDIDKPQYFDDTFNEIEFMFDLVTGNTSNTPYLYDIRFSNEIINND